MRIAVAGYFHETNTFALEHNDKLDARVLAGGDLFAKAHPKSYVGGFLKGMENAGAELIPTLDVHPIHGGILHASYHEHYRDAIVNALREAMPLDAVYFALHGAMAAEDPYTDAEGDLLLAARKAAGDIPFVATYDFHAIMSDQEARTLTAAFPNDTNPHIDSYERGLEAAECTLKVLRGEAHPVTRVVHVPIIGPNIGQSTWSQVPEEEQRLPLYQLNLVRAEMEQTPGIINLTILGGYGYADTPESMMSVIATADGDAGLAESKARELARMLWEKRHEILNVRPIYAVDEGVRLAMQRQDGLIVLADGGDDPGSATAADSPTVLESLLRQGARDAVVAIRDPEVVEAGLKAGIGATLEMEVGGKIEKRFYQPLKVRGVVKAMDDGNYVICGPSHGGWGRTVTREAFREVHAGPRVVLRVGNKIDVIISTGRPGNERDYYKSAGIVLEEKRILVVKSNQAHRASFGPIAAGIIDIATPGAATVDYLSLPFRHLRRPMWPIDRDFDWKP